MSVIWINVRLMGGEHLANVEVLFEDLQTTTVLMLKEKVYKACGIPIAQQTLFNPAGARVPDAGPLFADSLGRFQSRYLQFVVGAADILPAGLEFSAVFHCFRAFLEIITVAGFFFFVHPPTNLAAPLGRGIPSVHQRWGTLSIHIPLHPRTLDGILKPALRIEGH